MGRRTRECLLCGTKYEYCPTCSQDRMKPTWMSEFHSESCKNIFNICTSFNLQLLSKEEAKVALEQCDLSNKENFKSYVQRDIENIFAKDEDPKPKRGKRAELPILDEAFDPIIVHEVVNNIEENK